MLEYELYNAPKIRHQMRINKNPDRLQYAINQLEKNNLKYDIKNEYTCHLHTWKNSDNELIQFWAGTGKIQGHDERGVDNLIKLLLS